MSDFRLKTTAIKKDVTAREVGLPVPNGFPILILLAMNVLGKHVYQGNKREQGKLNRAKNKRARAQRKRNRAN